MYFNCLQCDLIASQPTEVNGYWKIFTCKWEINFFTYFGTLFKLFSRISEVEFFFPFSKSSAYHFAKCVCIFKYPASCLLVRNLNFRFLNSWIIIIGCLWSKLWFQNLAFSQVQDSSPLLVCLRAFKFYTHI